MEFWSEEFEEKLIELWKKHAVYMTYYIEKLHTVYLKLYKR